MSLLRLRIMYYSVKSELFTRASGQLTHDSRGALGILGHVYNVRIHMLYAYMYMYSYIVHCTCTCSGTCRTYLCMCMHEIIDLITAKEKQTSSYSKTCCINETLPGFVGSGYIPI